MSLSNNVTWNNFRQPTTHCYQTALGMYGPGSNTDFIHPSFERILPMNSLRLLEKADLSIYYDADKLAFDEEWLVRSGVTRESFMRATSDLPSVGFSIDGVEVGGSIFDGKQVHLAVLPEYHGKWAPLIQPWLEWLFSLKEIVDVRILIGNEKCIRFFDRNGFTRIAEDASFVSFRMSNHPGLFFNRRARTREKRRMPA